MFLWHFIVVAVSFMAIPQQVVSKKSGFQMVIVKGDTFVMGGNDQVEDGGPKGSQDECPHSVSVPNFLIGKYEVTQADWVAVMGTNPSYFKDCADCPVEQVSWDDVQEFIQKANAKYRTYYRLPTEVEWEFAARGGLVGKNFRYAGRNNANDVAWYNRNSGQKSHPVGTLQPNELGIYDMSGNIWEWCSDFKQPYPCDSQGKYFNSKVLRGGTWSNDSSSVRARDRNGRGAQLRLQTLGFRLARW